MSTHTDPARTARETNATASATASSDYAGEGGQPLRDKHIRGLQDARVVEGAQPSGGLLRPSPVGDIHLVDRHAAARLPSSRSDSSTTSAAGGCQLNTPAGCPSTTGVSRPHMPRTNRYSTPPKWRAGS